MVDIRHGLRVAQAVCGAALWAAWCRSSAVDGQMQMFCWVLLLTKRGRPHSIV